MNQQKLEKFEALFRDYGETEKADWILTYRKKKESEKDGLSKADIQGQ